ncbi:unnamed protein product [Porites lobata]|uniref:Uncharacterized protein n=1 Tax=Porites lobata TaxID=104759 RepID=A0ABN8PIQ1_9CNID|nr:unnamed protein product [Porites lobata]
MSWKQPLMNYDQGLLFCGGRWLQLPFYRMGRHQRYFSEELLNDIFVSDELASSKCFPMFLYLLDHPKNNGKLTVPLILHLLKPTFSEEGSNSLKYEKAVYSKFVKYLRDVARASRVTTLENILGICHRSK